MSERRLKWYHGVLALALFAGVMALEYFGFLTNTVYASLIGEILFAVIAVGVVLLARVDLKTVFVFRKIRPVQIAGLLLLWRGVFAVEEVVSSVALYLFPQFSSGAEGVQQMVRQLPFALTFLMVAVLPPVCEEMLFRGTVLRSMDGLKKTWLIIVVNGLIFGIAHLSVIKVFSVTLLGMLMAYVTYKTDNLTCSVWVHFINNAYAVLVTWVALKAQDMSGLKDGAQAVQSSTDVTVGSIGILVCAAALAPICLYIGRFLLLRPRKIAPGVYESEPGTLRKQWLLLAGAAGLLIAAVGVLLIALDFENLLMLYY